MAPVTDITQRAEGDVADWVNEPVNERNEELIVHTLRPYNAEPPNHALRHMITPKTLHFRRQHTPVPLIEPSTYKVSLGIENQPLFDFSLTDLKSFTEKEIKITLMCPGNRRSEFNSEEDGETLGLPWKNGCASTASWSGVLLADVLSAAGVTLESAQKAGLRFLTCYGLEDYHISFPLSKALEKDGECILAWKMNGQELPRDHGFPLRAVIPGLVGARSVKWVDRLVATKNQCEGVHQTGIAYKQLAPNMKRLSDVSQQYIHDLPPIDHVPVFSAVTLPEPGAKVTKGKTIEVEGYAYSGAGLAIIRVDVSMSGGKTWGQAEIERADDSQGVRSGKAWAWVQWKYKGVVPDVEGKLDIVCKAVDDQYNQQPNDPSSIWNLRGVLNTSWGRATVEVMRESLSGEAEVSGDEPFTM